MSDAQVARSRVHGTQVDRPGSDPVQVDRVRGGRAPAPRRRTCVVFSGGGTGGHLQPALALAGALARVRPDVWPFFVGARRGIEARILPDRGEPHLLLAVEGFRRGGSPLANAAVLVRLLRALARVGGLFHRLRPSMVVVTGGYAGGPAGLMALLMRIPLVLQEQNAAPGLVTRVLSTGAREVHAAFPEVRERLPARARPRVRISGNPVRPPTSPSREEACRTFGLDPARPVVLVVGGSQGSLALNRAVTDLLLHARDQGRPLSFQLLWSTGPSHRDAVEAAVAGSGAEPGEGAEAPEARDTARPGEAAGALAAAEPLEAADAAHPIDPGVRILGYIDNMEAALGCAHLAVSRAGAMATSEFLARGLPSVLVPLPTAAADHQRVNALALEAAGAALCVPEDELEGARLRELVEGLLADGDRLRAMAGAALDRGRPEAALEIARSLAKHLPPPPAAGPAEEGA